MHKKNVWLVFVLIMGLILSISCTSKSVQKTSVSDSSESASLNISFSGLYSDNQSKSFDEDIVWDKMYIYLKQKNSSEYKKYEFTKDAVNSSQINISSIQSGDYSIYFEAFDNLNNKVKMYSEPVSYTVKYGTNPVKLVSKFMKGTLHVSIQNNSNYKFKLNLSSVTQGSYKVDLDTAEKYIDLYPSFWTYNIDIFDNNGVFIKSTDKRMFYLLPADVIKLTLKIDIKGSLTPIIEYPCLPGISNLSAMIENNKIKIQWDASYLPENTIFDIARRKVSEQDFTLLASVTAKEFTDNNNLEFNAEYEYAVNAYKTYIEDNKTIVKESGIKTIKILFNNISVPYNYVFIQNGIFNMGSDNDSENEKPMHKITFNYHFMINKYEVTFKEFDSYCDATGKDKKSDRGWGRENKPAIYITWLDAINYCNWLSLKEGIPPAYDNEGNLLDSNGIITKDISLVAGYRLPTEAEWEYAAKGGKNSKNYKFSGSNNPDEVAWFSKNSGGMTQDIGLKNANELGLFDMSGNAWEWCYDSYQPYTSEEQINPVNIKGDEKVLRSGNWFDDVFFARNTARHHSYPDKLSDGYSFRVCRTILNTK